LKKSDDPKREMIDDPPVESLSIRPFDEADTDDVIRLWVVAGFTRPWNDPRRDIERKLGV